MRKILASLATVAILGAVLTAPAAAGGEKATGGATFDQNIGGIPVHLSFNAQLDKNGAKGQVSSQTAAGPVDAGTGVPWFDFRGVVDCYKQVGNVGFFSGAITTVGGFDYFVISVKDNGEPATDAPPDAARIRVTNNASDDCLNETTDTLNPNGPVSIGNFQVH